MLIRALRWFLIAAPLVAGVLLLIFGTAGAISSAFGVTLIAIAAMVWMWNWFIRMSFDDKSRENEDREREQRAVDQQTSDRAARDERTREAWARDQQAHDERAARQRTAPAPAPHRAPRKPARRPRRPE